MKTDGPSFVNKKKNPLYQRNSMHAKFGWTSSSFFSRRRFLNVVNVFSLYDHTLEQLNLNLYSWLICSKFNWVEAVFQKFEKKCSCI